MTIRVTSYIKTIAGWEQRKKLRKWAGDLLPFSPGPYGNDFYRRLDNTVRASAPHLSKTILRHFPSDSVIDIGCGNGWLLAAFEGQGATRTVGLEYSKSGIKQARKKGLNVEFVDLKAPVFSGDKQFDVCTCFEVAEHLEEEYSDEIVAFLTSFAPTIVFSAATPGQGGVDHVNEQPHSYWVSKFLKHGYSNNEELATSFRKEWAETGKVADWYCRNTLVLERIVSA